MAKTVLITGGSGGIGGMCAYEAAQHGYNIALCCNRHPERAMELARQLNGVTVFKADLTQSRQRRQLVDEVAEAFGSIDVLINNFGTSYITAFLDQDESEIERVIDTNLTSHILLTRRVLEQMIKRHTGAVINISSVWGVAGASCEVAYSAAKAGLIGFTKALAKEFGPSGITVNCIAPGCVDTKMLDGLNKAELTSMIPLGRLANGLEVAKAAFFLAEHGYITGQVLGVDGGMI